MKNIVKFCLFLLVSVLLFWLVYRDQNWEDLLKVLKEDVNYTWVWVACVMGIVSHVARALRWQMLAETMGYRIRFWNSFMGVMTILPFRGWGNLPVAQWWASMRRRRFPIFWALWWRNGWWM